LLGARSESEASALAATMKEMADALMLAGHSEYAPVLLAKAAIADKPTLKEIRKHCSALCAGKLRVRAKRAPGLTFRELAGRWTSGDLARQYPGHVKLKSSAGTDQLRLAKLYPAIGDIPIDAFTLDHAEL